MSPAPISVVLGARPDEGVRAIPVVVRSDMQYLAATLRQELVFNSWRHALAFCDVLGIPVVNRESAEQLAASEELPRVQGACWICGRDDGAGQS
jgi:hypothetical protein